MDNTKTGLEYRKARLQTFLQKGWNPDYNVTLESLAEAGFIYEGNGDQVMCVCCKVKIQDWDPGDEPLQEHKAVSSGCRFVKDPDRCEGDRTVVCDSIPKPNMDVVMFEPPTATNEGLPCIKCHKNKREILFQPCKHFIICKQCSQGVTKCPTCTSPIKNRVEASF